MADPAEGTDVRDATCSLDVCDRDAKTDGLCGRHYQRKRKGMPLLRPGNCPQCAAHIEDRHKNQVYCSIACRDIALSEYCKRKWREAREESGLLPGERRKYRRVPVQHGRSSEYARGCRCDACKKARTKQNNEWRLANPEKFLANQRRYRRRNPHKTRPANIARALAPFDDEALAYADLIARDPCVYCGGPAGEIDHIRAVTRGGDSSWGNLAPACKRCNSSKGAKSLLEFLMYRHDPTGTQPLAS